MAGFQTEFFVAVELVGRGEGGAAEPSGWSLAFRRACELPFPPARGVAWRFCVCCDALELPYDDDGQAVVYDPGREAFEVRLHAEWACRGALADGARAARTHYLSSGWASDPGADNMPREGEPF